VLWLAQFHPGDPLKSHVPDYEFYMKSAGSPETAGRISLRIGTNEFIRLYAGHIGYEVFPQWRGRHFAERAVRLLVPLAREHGLSELWITCNPENGASRRTCERLGAVLAGIVELPPGSDMYDRGERRKCRYRLSIASA
jgi:tagatose 1,6-diphosphate aldolase